MLAKVCLSYGCGFYPAQGNMLELLGGLLIATAISGVVPVLNAELLVLAAAALVPLAGLPFVVAVATGGQMLGKTTLFALARWLPRKLPKRARAALDRASRRVAAQKRGPATLVLTSAASGIPPLYGVSLACGALGMRLPTFVIMGCVGRAVRFGAIAWVGGQFGGQALEFFTGSTAASVIGGGP